jgi:hypothetical protein
MKTRSEPDDELVTSLVEETNALPRVAAAHARARQRTRMNAARFAAILVVSVLAAGLWFSQSPPRSKDNPQTAHAVNATDSVRTLIRQGFVEVYQAGEVPPDPIPPGATKREIELLTELPDVPLLIVKNEAGQVARVHIFAR